MWSTAVFIIAGGLFLNYFLYYRDWAHWGQGEVLTVKPGPCKVIQERGGSEDVVYIGDGIFLFTTGFELGQTTGTVKGIDVNDSPHVFAINQTNVPDNYEYFLANVHGMTLWKDSDSGKEFLYVLTHPPDKDKVEVFEVLKPLQLKYVKTISDPSFTFMNNLVAVGLDKFYITKYNMYRDTTSIMFEHLSHLRQGKIFYYDGKKARTVSSGYFLPNGLNVSPDMKMLYMAEWGGQRLHGFRRDSSNNLIKAWEHDMGTGVDNIDIDDNGHLWIGCHPRTWKIMDYFFKVFGSTLPSQVLRVKIKDGVVDEMEEIYSDNGQQCTGSTVASYRDGKLVIGTISEQTVVCDVKYLTP